jgi:hypothetical protein
VTHPSPENSRNICQPNHIKKLWILVLKHKPWRFLFVTVGVILKSVLKYWHFLGDARQDHETPTLGFESGDLRIRSCRDSLLSLIPQPDIAEN